MSKKPKYYHGGVSKFFFGWFVGFIFTITALAGLGYWVVKCMPIGSVSSLVGADLPISEEGKGNTIADVIGLAIGVASGSSDKSIEETANLLGLDLKGVISNTEEEDGTHYIIQGIDITPVIKGKLSQLSSNVTSVVDNIKLNDIVSATGITLPDISIINDARILNSPISSIGDVMTEIINEYTLNKLADDFDIEGLSSNTMLKSIIDTPISDISTAINDLRVKDIFPAPTEGPDNRNKIIKAIENIKITELGTNIQTTINTMKLSDVIDIPADSILASFADKTIGTLSTEFDDMTIGEIFPPLNVTFDEQYTFAIDSVVIDGAPSTTDNVIFVEDELSLDDGLTYTTSVVVTIAISKLDVPYGTIAIGFDNEGHIVHGETRYGTMAENNDLIISATATAFDCREFVQEDRDTFIVAFDDLKLSELSTGISSKVDTMKISDIIDVTGNSILGCLGDSTIGSLSEDINNLTIGDMFPGATNKILIALSDVKITELDSDVQSVIDGMILSDIITIPNDSLVLNLVANTSIGNLSTTINNLTIGNLFPAPSEGPDTRNSIIIALSATKINNLGTRIETLTLAEVMPSTNFNSGIFSLLYIVGTGTDTAPQYAKGTVPLSMMSEAISNLTNALMNQKTLSELHELGIISTEPNALIGSKTVNELIAYANNPLGA